MVICGSILLAAPSARADDSSLIAYLERHGLTELVVAHYESRLGEALGDDRIPIAERLALMYGRMLDESADESQRAEWERRSRALLELVPRANTEILRLSINKASYHRAERAAESWRLRLVGEEERRESMRIMNEVASALTEAHASLRTRIRRLEAAEVSREDMRTGRIERELRELDELASQAAYFAAWARYYHAFLSGTDAGLSEAVELFNGLLNLPRDPRPVDVPDSMPALEPAARAVVGIALCRTLMGRPDDGLQWLDVVGQSEETHEAVRAVIPAYRLVMLFSARRWRDIDSSVADLQRREQLTATTARLLAVLALEHAQKTGDSEARRLGADAVTLLAEMGQMRQVVEIAELFNLETLGGDSFAVAYVLALQQHERIRRDHGLDEPAADPDLIRRYAEAERALRGVIARRDAVAWADAVNHARLLIAWSQYYQNRLAEAARSFEEVAARLPREQAEQAAWMTIVCRDRLHRDDPEDERRRHLLESEMERFIERYPWSRRVGQVRLRQVAMQEGEAGMEAIELLLAVGPDSDAYAAARAEAERLLYALFRQSPPMQRLEVGPKYLQVALPLLEQDQRRAFLGSTDQETRQRYVQRARRVLDVLLARGIARLSEAGRILDRLDTARAARLIDLAAIATELDYRRFQLRMLGGEWSEAERWSEALWSSDADSPFALAASRELYAYAVQDWRAYGATADTDVLKRVIRYGRRSLGGTDLQSVRESQTEPSPGPLSPEAVGIMLNVAEAAWALHELEASDDLESLATDLFERLLEAQPRNYRILKGSALIAEAAGDRERAVTHWRTALAGSDDSQKEWFEAKYHVVRLLMTIDQRRARDVMEQHEVFYPDYGPEPWGPRLRELAGELRDA